MPDKETILAALESYFELTQFSQEHEGAEPNPDWDCGFQAAMAIVRGMN